MRVMRICSVLGGDKGWLGVTVRVRVIALLEYLISDLASTVLRFFVILLIVETAA